MHLHIYDLLITYILEFYEIILQDSFEKENIEIMNFMI